MHRLEATVMGKVQGVAFRSYVSREAMRYSLVGAVTNNSDGSVTVIAEGPRVALQSFLSRLYEGPSEAKVDHIDKKWGEAQGKFSSFSIE